MADQTLQLKLTQKLSLAPQLQQAIRLLQLNRIELREYIQDALDSNPLLERGESDSFQTQDADDANSEREPDNDGRDEDLIELQERENWDEPTSLDDRWLESGNTGTFENDF